MTYREMLDLLKSKGVKVDEDRMGFKADGEEGLMKYWMVRTKNEGQDAFYFCCGFDMLGEGRLVISHKDYPLDETVFDSLMDAIKRNYTRYDGTVKPLPSPDNILLCPDTDYYTMNEAPREDDKKTIMADLVISYNDDVRGYTYVCLIENGSVLSGTLYRKAEGDKMRIEADIRAHWDRREPAQENLSKEYDRNEFFTDAGRLTEMAIMELCEGMGVTIMRCFNL